MIAVDTNILVYSHRSDSPFHQAADKALTDLAESGELWAIPWPCIHEFLAIVTHPRIYDPPTPLADAIAQVECRVHTDAPDQNIADLTAQVAANATGVAELRKMVDHYGIDVVSAYMGHVQDNAEECVRRVIDRLDDGDFDYPMDDGSLIRVAVRVHRETRSVTIGSSSLAKRRTSSHATRPGSVFALWKTLPTDSVA